MDKLLLLFSAKIFGIWFFLYLCIVFINYFRKKYTKIFNKKDLENSRSFSLIYLDQFYITNKIYNFFAVFIYLFFMFFIFIILRFIAIGDITLILPRDFKHINYLSYLYIYLIFFITIYLYQILLTMLFKKELNKFYIYFKSSKWYFTIRYLLEFKLSEFLFARLYLIMYHISLLIYREDLYFSGLHSSIYSVAFRTAYLEQHGKEYEDIFNAEYDYVITNKNIIKLAYKVQHLAKKYVIIQKLLKFICHIFKFFFKHISSLWKPFPYIILFIIFIFELFQNEFNNIYICSFIVLLIKLKRDFLHFITNRGLSEDSTLSRYFYRNEVDYKKQRLYLYNKDKTIIIKNFESNANRSLIYELKDIIKYTFNNFTEKENFEIKQYKRKHAGIYRRFWLIIGYITVVIYLYIRNDIQMNFFIYILINISIILLIYLQYKTAAGYTCESEPPSDEESYSFTYNVLFWLLAIVQGGFFFILLLLPEIIFIENNILWDIGFKITRIYTTENKIIYLFKYFEYYVTLSSLSTEDITNLRFFIRQIDYANLIDETVMLKDIQVYIKLLIENCLFLRHYDIIFKDLITNTKDLNPWYLFLSNTIMISAVTMTLLYYNNLFVKIEMLLTPYGIFVIGKNIVESFIKYYK